MWNRSRLNIPPLQFGEFPLSQGEMKQSQDDEVVSQSRFCFGLPMFQFPHELPDFFLSEHGSIAVLGNGIGGNDFCGIEGKAIGFLQIPKKARNGVELAIECPPIDHILAENIPLGDSCQKLLHPVLQFRFGFGQQEAQIFFGHSLMLKELAEIIFVCGMRVSVPLEGEEIQNDLVEGFFTVGMVQECSSPCFEAVAKRKQVLGILHSTGN